VTAHTTGFNADGYGRILERCLLAKQNLEQAFVDSGLPVLIVPGTDTNILALAIGRHGRRLSELNYQTKTMHERLSPGQRAPFVVSKTSISFEKYKTQFERFQKTWGLEVNRGEVFLLRMCLMNPFFSSKETHVDYQTELLKVFKKMILG
jgi:hypothetical protein